MFDSQKKLKDCIPVFAQQLIGDAGKSRTQTLQLYKLKMLSHMKEE